ncbi:putative bifunctional diguanylate cyclase/phosphodiesterase [Pararhizobium sp. PWRC1-1]|uniref:putative bifunctional diguanylate cyclase/phosphodiesterase n=1 Tax=Pararhizobium sp. PWRC1-1 TaxID=2804566 RepID=UPI003CF5BA52
MAPDVGVDRRHELVRFAARPGTDALYSFYDWSFLLVDCSKQFSSLYGLDENSSLTLQHLYPGILRIDAAAWQDVSDTMGHLVFELPEENEVKRTLFMVPSPQGIAALEFRDIPHVRKDDDRAVLLHQATHDPLTGLPNRREFGSQLSAALKHRDSSILALMQLDLDDFKPVNDTLGHGAGDIVLRETADRLKASLQLGETAYRLAGDEFAVIKQHCGTRKAGEDAAERLVKAFQRPFEAYGITLFVGASVGVAFAPEDGEDTEGLMKAADVALYAAKKDGRGRASIFEAGMLQVLEQRELLRRSLRLALQREEFFVEYQPITGPGRNITGFEALLRWRHPMLGVIPPVAFITVAEADGLMPEIGQWVLETACRAALTWPDHLTVAVNVSPAEFLTTGITDRISAVLDETGLPSERLELEITETVLLERTTNNLDTLNTLNILGIKISLDDFGTEYSSLSYLKNFPFDNIKIDKYFISDLSTDLNSQTIVKSIIGMAHGLDMRVIAEGVETLEQELWLWDAGCDLIQGYAISKPMPAETVANYLNSAFQTDHIQGGVRNES